MISSFRKVARPIRAPGRLRPDRPPCPSRCPATTRPIRAYRREWGGSGGRSPPDRVYNLQTMSIDARTMKPACHQTVTTETNKQYVASILFMSYQCMLYQHTFYNKTHCYANGKQLATLMNGYTIDLRKYRRY